MRKVLRAAGLAVALVLVTAMPARAGWRDDFKVLRIGTVAPRGAAYEIARLEPFRAYLQDRLGLPVEIVATADYHALIDAQASARVDYAIHSASSYVTTEALCSCVEPIALPAAFDGAHGFHSVLVAHAGSGITDLAGSRGKRLALTGADSVAGRLLPLAALSGQGIDAQAYYAAVRTAANPEQAITMLFTDEADLAAGWSSLAGAATTGYYFGVFTRMVSAGALAMDRIRIVWKSPLIPFGPHVVRRDLPAELRALISDALMAMAAEAPDALDAVDASSIGGGGFVPGPPGLCRDCRSGGGATGRLTNPAGRPGRGQGQVKPDGRETHAVRRGRR
jgi:phosphonate transport system substrate-binding protein